MLHLLYIFLVKNKFNYIRLQLISAFIFSILYYLQDYLMIKYNNIMVNLKLGNILKMKKYLVIFIMYGYH